MIKIYLKSPRKSLELEMVDWRGLVHIALSHGVSFISKIPMDWIENSSCMDEDHSDMDEDFHSFSPKAAKVFTDALKVGFNDLFSIREHYEEYWINSEEFFKENGPSNDIHSDVYPFFSDEGLKKLQDVIEFCQNNKFIVTLNRFMSYSGKIVTAFGNPVDEKESLDPLSNQNPSGENRNGFICDFKMENKNEN